ncbi:hypothetical protein [Pseudomonas sp.]|uniref:hypothetical protein n=1 Tax=Pseudomonas sp. TaxID=306 RepID=UPI00289A8813|nr:hypothetical protein [Pseudomonas sp.]
MNINSRSAIEQYIRAKDGNRPHLMAMAFHPDATLEMQVHTGAISFPAKTKGLKEISNVLVSRFGATFENIYTFCLGDPPEHKATVHTNKWLVAMSDKQTAKVKVGCGLYNWSFKSGLVSKLQITIEHMHVLPPEALCPIMTWVAPLPYPWVSQAELTNLAPDLEAISDILNYIRG